MKTDYNMETAEECIDKTMTEAEVKRMEEERVMSDSSVQLYLRQMARTPLMNAKEEIAAFKAIAAARKSKKKSDEIA